MKNRNKLVEKEWKRSGVSQGKELEVRGEEKQGKENRLGKKTEGLL